MKRALIVHYSEIGLKKSNTGYFLKKLMKHIRAKFKNKFSVDLKVSHSLGRILIPLEDGFSDALEADYATVLSRIFGIKNFKFVYLGSLDMKELGEQLMENLSNDAKNAESFRVKVKRSQLMPLSSIEMERELGAIMLRSGFEKKVQMKGSDLVVDLEIFNMISYFSYKKYEGVGGLSSCTGGKLISLLSSGIDSPVASYKMMKRGARVIFAHFHAYPYTDKDEMEQCEEIVEILSDFQFDTKLYLVPFGEIQKAIATNLDVPAKLRTVLYRRMMLRIAERLAKKDEAKGLITGDNYGQVASQTAENMFTIHDASTIPIYQPLIAYDKSEIIMESEKIGTFGVSKLPCKDSCSMFMPKHPELKANIFDTNKVEENLPIEEWIEKAMSELEVKYF